VTDRHPLEATVRRIDGELRRLNGPHVDLSAPGLLDRMREAAEVYRRQEPEREAARQEADRLLPELLDLYRSGGDDDREWVRDLLHACRTLRWAVGRGVGLPQPPIGLEGAAQALALFSMKDGDADYRDQIVWLDGLCAALRKFGLDLPPLLRHAAGWSNDTPRFPPARSTRALLLDYARRFAT
jgi:hypothetical protein